MPGNGWPIECAALGDLASQQWGISPGRSLSGGWPACSLVKAVQGGASGSSNGKSGVPKATTGPVIALLSAPPAQPDVLGVLDIGPRKNRTGFLSDDKRAPSQLGAEIGTSIYAAQLGEKKVK